MKPITILLAAFFLCTLVASAQSVQFDHCVRHWKTNGPLPGLVRSYTAIDPSLPDSVLFSLTDTTLQTCLAVEVPESTVLAVKKFKIGLDKKDRPLNGVSVVDLMRIQYHILGLEQMPFWAMLAADVNRSGSITFFDILQAQNLILRKDTLYHGFNRRPWRFISNQHPFPSPTNPFVVPPFPSQPMNVEVPTATGFLTYHPDSLRQWDGDTLKFVGVKVGDVDSDANLSGGIYTASPTDSMTLTVPDITVSDGDLVFIPFFLPNGTRLQAMQLEIVSKSPFLILKTFTSDYDFITQDNTYLLPDGRGRVATVANISAYPNGIQLPPNKPTFYLKVQATQPVALKDALALRVDSIPAISVGNGSMTFDIGKTHRLDLAFSSTVATGSPAGNTLHATPATPNPFRDKAFVEIELPEATPVLLEVYDLSGQLRWTQEQTLGAGKHQVEIPGEAVERSSMGLYRLRAGAGVATGKVVRI